MSVMRPYRRTCQQFVDGKYTESGRWMYILHPKYAQSPEQYVRSFLLIQKDLQELFDYVEPADENLDSYSYRIQALLLRACIEVEANFKAIFKENRYTVNERYWTIKDYKKINTTHRLSSYQVAIPYWTGNEKKDSKAFFKLVKKRWHSGLVYCIQFFKA